MGGEGEKKKENALSWITASSVTSGDHIIPFKVDQSKNRSGAIFNTSEVNTAKDNFIYQWWIVEEKGESNGKEDKTHWF